MILKKLLAMLLVLTVLLPVRAEDAPRCGITAHTHTADCYAQVRTLTCGKLDITPEPHVHTAACYDTRLVLTCTQDHAHSLTCYTMQQVLVCAVPEGTLQYHQHTDSCYTTETMLTCTLPEHTHTQACYSDKTADLESSADWEATLSDVILTGDRAADLIAVAKTQLGYQESTVNYSIETDQGYTRYGAWAGKPYSDWCAAFVSFCLSYAQVDFPRSLVCDDWVRLLREQDLFSADVTPLPGDLVFITEDGGATAGHVGILAELDGDTMTLIEGNFEMDGVDQVCLVTRRLTDDNILGYGLVALREEASDAVLAGTDGRTEAVSDTEVPARVRALLSQLGRSCPQGTGPYGAWSGPDYSPQLLSSYTHPVSPLRTRGTPRAGDIVWFDHERVGLVLYAEEELLVTVRVVGNTVCLSSGTGPILGYARAG